MRATFLFAAALLAIAAPAVGQSVKAGIEAWQNGDYEAAVEIWRPLAQEGDADAAFNLGQAYRLGRGVPINLATAQGWLERAAREDHVDAQTTLGLLLFGNGNRITGIRWLRQAAEQGEPRAMLVYGTALFNGDGAPRDPVLAYAYVSRAAAQGLPAAKETLAEMDSILPLEVRKKGVAIALDKAKGGNTEAPAKVASKSEPPARKESKIPPQVEKAKAAPAPSGRWRIQLGAFSKDGSARALFDKLSASAPIAGRQRYLVSAGKLTKLQVGPFESQADAAAACRTLKAKGQACFPVAPD